MSGRAPGGRFDQVQGPLDDRQVAQPEEVHLEQAQVLDPVHFVLGDDGGVLGPPARLRLALDGQVLGERLAGDHHRGGVDAVLAPQALEPPGHVDDLGHVGIGVVHLAQLDGRRVAVGVLRVLVEARPQRRVAAHHQRRHGLGDPVARGCTGSRGPGPRRGPPPGP